jgi:hypothetical protein
MRICRRGEGMSVVSDSEVMVMLVIQVGEDITENISERGEIL